MKRLLCVLLWMIASLARADDLSDANKLLAAKAYDKAFPIYAKLANAGNPEAQFRLGEMYWYGDGTAMDLAKANAWFQKAAAAGNADARDSLAILKRRETRGADIAYWTSGYAGEDLTSGKFDCKAPALPELSRTNEQIAAANKQIAEWSTCYNGFVANVNARMPPVKQIPADVAEMMTPAEIEQARRHVEEVYGKVIANADAGAAAAAARHDAWRAATQAYVKEKNLLIAKENEANNQMLMEQLRRSREAGMQPQITSPASQPHARP